MINNNAESGSSKSTSKSKSTAESQKPHRDGPPVRSRTSRFKKHYDLIVVGSGAAAFAAAIRGRKLGATVGICEADTIGGTCVNRGCIPSKALLAAANSFYASKHVYFPGVYTGEARADLAAILEWKDKLVSRLRHEKYEELAEHYGIDILRGWGSFEDPETFLCDNSEVGASSFVVATGASPAAPPIDGLKEAGYLDSTTALQLTEVPESLAVIGANAIGLELGQLFMYLGSKVTFFEAKDRIAPFEEPEISEKLASLLQNQGAQIITSSSISRVRKTSNGYAIELGNTSSLSGHKEFSKVLVATGRKPNTSGLGLDSAKVRLTANGAIEVDATMQTSNPRIWAAGDVTPFPQFVYVAAAQGSTAAENALRGARRALDWKGLPRVTFTTPAIAAVGMTADEARKAGVPVREKILPIDQIPRAIVEADDEGLFKMVIDDRDKKVLGIHILSRNAGEVIQAAVYAIKAGFSVDQIAEYWAPYLTMAEGLKLLAQSFTQDVSKLSCCAA